MKFYIPFFFLVAMVWSKPQDLSLAKQYYKDAVYRSAAEYFQRYLADQPAVEKVAVARLGLAQSLYQLGDLEGSLRSFEEYLSLGSYNSLVSFCETNKHPYKSFLIEENEIKPSF